MLAIVVVTDPSYALFLQSELLIMAEQSSSQLVRVFIPDIKAQVIFSIIVSSYLDVAIYINVCCRNA